MAVIVPSGQPTQLVGLPPLSDETYARLDIAMRELYQKYREAAQADTTRSE